ncbi:MAG: hypothetical protein M3O46_13435 [Myxococcota bacterium]|nr:hypothetical protein [Myxococcota bacterium]
MDRDNVITRTLQVAWIAVMATVSGCSGSPTQEAIGTSHSALVLNNVGLYEDTPDVGVNLLTESSQGSIPAKSVGVLRIDHVDANNVRNTSNCGATFITPHLAITANHCVPPAFGYQIGSPIRLEEIDTRSYDPMKLQSQAVVLGSWNGGTAQSNQYYRPNPTGPADGYIASPLDCHVYARCRAAYQPPSPDCAGVSPDADLAIVSCPDRDVPYFVVPATHDRAVGTAIEVRWFHEIVDLVGDHYTILDTTNETNNYHYNYNPAIDTEKQYFPLLSSYSAGNVPYVILNDFPQLTEVGTSAGGCHGMSGSGVFLGNTNVFLGVVVGGAADGVLCDDLNDPNVPANPVSYVRATETRQLWKNLQNSNEY